MTTEKTTDSVFDVWLKDGRFSADAFRRENSLTRIKEAVEFAHSLASQTPNIDMPKEMAITDDESLMVYLAHVAKALGDNSKAFGNGKRVVVYFAISYAMDVPSDKERIALLGKMPELFSYQLGSTPTKAWRDMLSNANVYPHMTRSVGKDQLPQAIFAKVSLAVTKIASGYTDPNSKRKVVREFFDGYWREFGTFASDTDTVQVKPNMTELVALWNNAHPEETTDDRTKRRSTAGKEKRQRSMVDDILLGKADEDSVSKLDAYGQAQIAHRIKNAGYSVVTRPELLAIEEALRIDHGRKDAIGVLENAVDALRKIDILVSTALQFARDHAAKKTETPKLPSVDCTRASFAKAFRLSGKELSDLENVDVITLARQSNDIHKTDLAGVSEDGSKILSSVVSSRKMYTFRGTRNTIGKANEFVVNLTQN